MDRQIGVKDFSENILGQTIHFHVIRMQNSVWLWAGSKPSLKSLAVAMQTRFDKHPTSLQLLGSSTEPSSSSNLAKQMARKTGCQCFVSVNVADENFYPVIEKYIMELVEKEPQMFYFE